MLNVYAGNKRNLQDVWSAGVATQKINQFSEPRKSLIFAGTGKGFLLSLDAGDKKNNAGEQVCEDYSIFEGADLRGGSWVAGVARTRRRFLLC